MPVKVLTGEAVQVALLSGESSAENTSFGSLGLSLSMLGSGSNNLGRSIGNAGSYLAIVRCPGKASDAGDAEIESPKSPRTSALLANFLFESCSPPIS